VNNPYELKLLTEQDEDDKPFAKKIPHGLNNWSNVPGERPTDKLKRERIRREAKEKSKKSKARF
jgi:hypothetical protein